MRLILDWLLTLTHQALMVMMATHGPFRCFQVCKKALKHEGKQQ